MQNREIPPFLRWAGSKRRLLPVLREYWQPKHKRYIEPFAGSACLYFSLGPHKAILGDLNRDLIRMYREVKYRSAGVLQELAKLPPAEKKTFLRLRALVPDEMTPAARAARFIYLNRFCFNGIYRTNLKGQFNVPFGGDRTGSLPNVAAFAKCVRLLRNAKLVNGDFDRVLSQAEPGDFVYMDPPYAVRARRVFTEYGPNPFSHPDIGRLRKWMMRLDASKIDFVVSYAECEESDLLRKGFQCQTVPVRRHISGFAGSRSITNEVIISN